MAVNHHYPQGFTLIEAMVTIVLLGIFAVLGIPYFSGYIRDAKIVGVGSEIESGLIQAKMAAMSRNTNVIFNLNGTSWNVVLPGTNGSPDTVLFSRVTNSSEINIVVTPATAAINFNSSGHISPPNNFGISLTYPSSDTCRAAGGTTHCMQLNISAGGQIKYCDPALPVTDARAC